MATVNYDAIAQELKRGLVDSEAAAARMGGDKPMALKELYTLSMSGPRQTGKTKWIVEQMIRDTNTRVVVINKSSQKEITDRIRSYKAMDDNNMIMVSGNQYKVPDDLAALIRRDPLRLNVINVLTSIELISIFKLFDKDPEKEKLLPNISQVIFDGRTQICHRIRMSKYYTWLAERTDGYALTWLID